MADISVALGAAIPFEFEGVTYTLVPWDRFSVQKAYVEHLKRCAYDEAFAAKLNGSIPAVEWEAYITALQQKMAGGAYGWGGPVWWESLNSPERNRYLAWLTMKVNHPEIMLETVYRIHAHPEKGVELAVIFKGMVSDPNCQMPAAPAMR